MKITQNPRTQEIRKAVAAVCFVSWIVSWFCAIWVKGSELQYFLSGLLFFVLSILFSIEFSTGGDTDD